MARGRRARPATDPPRAPHQHPVALHRRHVESGRPGPVPLLDRDGVQAFRSTRRRRQRPPVPRTPRPSHPSTALHRLASVLPFCLPSVPSDDRVAWEGNRGWAIRSTGAGSDSAGVSQVEPELVRVGARLGGRGRADLHSSVDVEGDDSSSHLERPLRRESEGGRRRPRERTEPRTRRRVQLRNELRGRHLARRGRAQRQVPPLGRDAAAERTTTRLIRPRPGKLSSTHHQLLGIKSQSSTPFSHPDTGRRRLQVEPSPTRLHEPFPLPPRPSSSFPLPDLFQLILSN